MILGFAKLLIISPIRFFRFLRLEREDGVSLAKALEKLYLSAHIFVA